MQNLLTQTNILYIIAVWELIWKASKKDHKYWFVSLLILNTVGILPIGYLVFNKYSASKNIKTKKK